MAPMPGQWLHRVPSPQTYVHLKPRYPQRAGAPRARPRRALRGGISKVNFEQSLSTFGNTCPQNGSKNEPRAPRTSLGYPHRGPFVDAALHPGSPSRGAARLRKGRRFFPTCLVLRRSQRIERGVSEAEEARAACAQGSVLSEAGLPHTLLRETTPCFGRLRRQTRRSWCLEFWIWGLGFEV